MKFTSTRKTESVSGGEAVLNGTPAGGGLYVPSEFPVFSENEIAEFCKMTYPERVAAVFKKFFDDFSYYELLDYAEKAYASFEDVCPVVKLEDESYVAELWHGPTATCKDLSLAMMPYVIEAAKKKLGLTKKTLAVFATTGNTGKAALESFTGHSGSELVVVYPDAVMDYLQKLQLVTHVGDNTHVFGVKGSFSEAKESVSAFFSNKENKIALSASGYEAVDVSSVNWCRITAEIACVFSVYADLMESEEIAPSQKVNLCIPTSSGSMLAAAYYAKKMGLPVDRIIVAVNENNHLAKFFSSGEYQRPKTVALTNSPSLDAARCRNLERILYEISGRNAAFVSEKMEELALSGKFKVDKKLLDDCDIVCGYATEDEIIDTIEGEFEENDYVCDPHTAVAVSVWLDYLTQAEDKTPTVLFSTASPFRYPIDVLFAITEDFVRDPVKAIRKLEEATALDAPEALKKLSKLQVTHNKIVELSDVSETIFDFIK